MEAERVVSSILRGELALNLKILWFLSFQMHQILAAAMQSQAGFGMFGGSLLHQSSSTLGTKVFERDVAMFVWRICL